MYRVSPQLLVTNEHIISDNSSTASSGLSGSLLGCRASTLCRLSPLVLGCGSGDANKLRGVDSAPSFGVLWCEGEVGLDPGIAEALLDDEEFLLSAKRFSKVLSNAAKSVVPSLISPALTSAQIHIPDVQEISKHEHINLPDFIRRRSIRPILFSSPSMYLALFGD